MAAVVFESNGSEALRSSLSGLVKESAAVDLVAEYVGRRLADLESLFVYRPWLYASRLHLSDVLLWTRRLVEQQVMFTEQGVDIAVKRRPDQTESSLALWKAPDAQVRSTVRYVASLAVDMLFDLLCDTGVHTTLGSLSALAVVCAHYSASVACDMGPNRITRWARLLQDASQRPSIPDLQLKVLAHYQFQVPSASGWAFALLAGELQPAEYKQWAHVLEPGATWFGAGPEDAARDHLQSVAARCLVSLSIPPVVPHERGQLTPQTTNCFHFLCFPRHARAGVLSRAMVQEMLSCAVSPGHPSPLKRQRGATGAVVTAVPRPPTPTEEVKKRK